MKNDQARIQKAIRAAKSDLYELQQTRYRYTGSELRAVDQKIKVLQEKIAAYEKASS